MAACYRDDSRDDLHRLIGTKVPIAITPVSEVIGQLEGGKHTAVEVGS
jgi:hypothetical protein